MRFITFAQVHSVDSVIATVADNLPIGRSVVNVNRIFEMLKGAISMFLCNLLQFSRIMPCDRF